MDCWQRQGQAEGSSDGKGQGKAKGKNGGKGEGKVNNITDEPPDSEQPVDPGIVGSVTLEDRIVVLAREAPPADLNPNSGFDVDADTLRTASGHAPTLYGHCALKMQVPPIAGTARVDVRSSPCSLADSVSGDVGDEWPQSAVSRRGCCVGHGGLSRPSAAAYSWLVVSAGLDQQQHESFVLIDSGAACHVCPPAVGSSCES